MKIEFFAGADCAKAPSFSPRLEKTGLSFVLDVFLFWTFLEIEKVAAMNNKPKRCSDQWSRLPLKISVCLVNDLCFKKIVSVK